MSNQLTLKVFDVSQGSCNLIISPTGKVEMVDFGSETDWSPVKHVFANYLPKNGSLDRLVLTHHHGDHLSDWDNMKFQAIDLVIRRRLDGEYKMACKASNLPHGQKRAEAFDAHFETWTPCKDESKTSAAAWGVTITHRELSIDAAKELSNSDNSIVNNCSYVRLYDCSGTKILLAGDMETQGMEKILSDNPKFKQALSGVNILIAPHHGHKSGFCSTLFSAIGKPDIVIASMKTGNKNVDSRYSSEDYVKGVLFDDGSTKRLLTTRSNGAVTVTTSGNGTFGIQTQQR
jgi:beta-lactamase superfamily II metal-dependent hydrolase